MFELPGLLLCSSRKPEGLTLLNDACNVRTPLRESCHNRGSRSSISSLNAGHQDKILPINAGILQAKHISIEYNEIRLKRTYSKANNCLKRTKDFAPKYQFSGQSLINLTCLKQTEVFAQKVSALDRFHCGPKIIIAPKRKIISCPKHIFQYIT